MGRCRDEMQSGRSRDVSAITTYLDDQCDVLNRECVFAKEEMTPKIDGNSLRAVGQCPWSYKPYSGSIGIDLDHHNQVNLIDQ